MFDIRLSDEQREFQRLAREFAQKEIKPVAIALDQEPKWEKRVPWDLLKKGSQLGFRTFVLSEENGGSGASDQLTNCLVAEELAAGDIGTAYYFMLTARRARDWFELRMTPEQRAYFLPKFLNDDLFFTTVAIPASKPPPPTGTTIVSSRGACSRISSAIVPCPAMTDAWL